MIVPPHLVAHLDRCTVQVHGEDGFVGSGVFAAPGVVITCAHVVRDAESECRVLWQGHFISVSGEPDMFPSSEHISDDWYPFPDLAVLRLTNPPSHPCAWLGTEDPPIGSQVYASGFSTHTLTDGAAPDGLLVQVAAQSSNFLRVKHDQIYGGLSGSPVLDVASGRVCGLVKATRDESDERGGWIIPATAFARYLQPVLEENRAYHSIGPAWDQLLPVQDLPAALRNLFEAQRKAAKEMPYQLTGAPRVNLADIYVRQQLGQRLKDSDTEKDSGRDKDHGREKDDSKDLGAGLAAPSEDMAGSGAVRDLGAALALHHDLLVTGGPGAGKSTLTLQLAGELAGAWLDRGAPTKFAENHPGFQAPRPLVPLRVSARSLVAKKELGWLRALAAAATVELNLSNELSAEMISTPVAGALWLIIIDALDEIADTNAYRDLLSMLTDCMVGQGSIFPHRLLITSRFVAEDDIDLLTSPGGTKYTLVPFDEPALRLFAQRWFAREGQAGENLAERFLTQVRTARLTELVTIPLLVTVAAIVFEQDPDQLLPAHRYQLYQKYFEYLLSGRDQAFIEQWPQLERQLSVYSGGKKLADKLHEERIGLVEHLAVKRLESASRLADEAADWVRAKAHDVDAFSDLKPLNWPETALAVVMTTGLFLHEGDDIFFLHQSFAEHLAARVFAERFPRPFIPSEGNWRDWVDRAAIYGMPDLAHTVLTHYTRLHSGEGIIAWLQCQTVPFYQLLAGELISYGAASTPDAVTIFCAAFRDWARWSASGFSTRVFSRSLAVLVELLDHSCASSVLMQVAVDELVTLPRRIVAAKALANAGHPHAESGVAALHQALSDPHAKASDEVLAARAVAGLGPQYHQEAATVLRRVLANTRIDSSDRRQAAESLAGLDPQYREEAATALREITANRRTGVSGRVQAAESLARLDPQYREEAATALREITANRRTGVSGRVQAAESLARLDPQYREEAATALRETIASPATSASDQRQAVQSLARLDPQCREETATALRATIASPATSVSGRLQAAQSLGDLDPDYREEEITVLRETIANPATSASDFLQATRSLARLDPQSRKEAATALREVIANRRTEVSDRLLAALSLVQLGPRYYEEVATALRRVLANRHADTLNVQWAATSLAGLGPQYREEAAAALRKIIANPGTRASEGPWTAERLARLGLQYREEAAAALRKIIDNRRANAYDRVQAAQSLNKLDPQYRQEVAAALREMIADRGADASDRRVAALSLHELDPQYREEAAAALREIIADRRADASDRKYAAESLGKLGPDYRKEAAAALREIIDNPDTSMFWRKYAAESLGKLGPDYREEAAAALRQIIANPENDGFSLEEAVKSLCELDPQYRYEAAAALLQIIANPDTQMFVRDHAIKSLGGLDLDYREEAAAALREIIASPDTEWFEREQAVSSLGGLDPGYREEAAAALREIIDNPETHMFVRERAVKSLCELDPGYREEVAATLRETIASPATSASDRRQAAKSLGELDPQYREEAATVTRRRNRRILFTSYALAYAVFGIAFLTLGHIVIGICGVIAAVIIGAAGSFPSRFCTRVPFKSVIRLFRRVLPNKHIHKSRD